jgi:hypothetical protein
MLGGGSGNPTTWPATISSNAFMVFAGFVTGFHS